MVGVGGSATTTSDGATGSVTGAGAGAAAVGSGAGVVTAGSGLGAGATETATVDGAGAGWLSAFAVSASPKAIPPRSKVPTAPRAADLFSIQRV